jgi:hypothetical protein
MSALEKLMNKDLPEMTPIEYAIWYLCVGGDKHHAEKAAAVLARKDAIEKAAREFVAEWRWEFDGIPAFAALAAALGKESP